MLSIRAYAKYKGVSDTAVRKAIQSGRITTTNGQIDPSVADKQWNDNTNPGQQAAATEKPCELFSYQASRARRETYDALLKKLEYEERSGKLIPIAQVENEAFNAARIARDKLMTIADRAVSQIIGKTDAFEIRQILQNEIRACLLELTDFLNGTKS